MLKRVSLWKSDIHTTIENWEIAKYAESLE